MTDFEKVMMNRDRMTAEEARNERMRAAEELDLLVAQGASYDEVEDMLMDDYGLEMDYILDLLL